MNEPLAFTVRPATDADVPGMTKTLADAFQSGELTSTYIFPDEDERRRRQPRMFEALIRHRYLPTASAEVAVDDAGRIVGAAMWKATGHRPSLKALILENWALLAAMGIGSLRGLAIDRAIHRAAQDFPHVFGVYLGTAPDWQRTRRVGEALLKSVSQKCFQEGRSLCAVCSDENLPYYVARGATHIGTVRVGLRGPTLNVFAFRPPAT